MLHCSHWEDPLWLCTQMAGDVSGSSNKSRCVCLCVSGRGVLWCLEDHRDSTPTRVSPEGRDTGLAFQSKNLGFLLLLLTPCGFDSIPADVLRLPRCGKFQSSHCLPKIWPFSVWRLLGRPRLAGRRLRCRSCNLCENIQTPEERPPFSPLSDVTLLLPPQAFKPKLSSASTRPLKWLSLLVGRIVLKGILTDSSYVGLRARSVFKPIRIWIQVLVYIHVNNASFVTDQHSVTVFRC